MKRLRKKIDVNKIKADVAAFVTIMLLAAAVCFGIEPTARTDEKLFYRSTISGGDAETDAEIKTETIAAYNASLKSAKPVLGADGKVHINTATEAELTLLYGVGAAKAKKIAALRDEIGAFKSADDLICVDGIGEALLERNRDLITVE